MASIRIRGLWRLSLAAHQTKPELKAASMGEAQLDIRKADRAGLSGEVRFGRKKIPVKGRVKPGSPAVVTLLETKADGEAVADGLEAILYIPPWWPTVDYEYDLVFGTMVVGNGSSYGKKELKSKLIAITGVQPFA